MARKLGQRANLRKLNLRSPPPSVAAFSSIDSITSDLSFFGHTPPAAAPVPPAEVVCACVCWLNVRYRISTARNFYGMGSVVFCAGLSIFK